MNEENVQAGKILSVVSDLEEDGLPPNVNIFKLNLCYDISYEYMEKWVSCLQFLKPS
jgi:hypothetical protein